MKYIYTLLLLSFTFISMAQTGKAITVKKPFSRSTSISTDINADAETVWALLTNASEFPNWNSTVVSIDGKIKTGEKIKLKAAIDTTRTFKLKVKEMVPNKSMVWADAMGKRTYTITKTDSGVTFNMSEKIGGLMFPLFANKIPSFDDAFENFAADLKKKAEAS